MLTMHSAAAASGGAPSASLQPALLDVSVNGQAAPEPLLFLQDGKGGLYASAAALRQWRILAPTSAPMRFEAEDYHRIDNLPSLRVTVSAQKQSVIIEARAELFERQSAAFMSSEQIEMTPAATGGFLNYDLFLEHSSGGTRVNGAFEAGLFTPRGVGVASFVAGAGAGKDVLTRLETSWTIDRPSSLSTIRIGDSISSVGPGAVPVHFAGFQYARNFAVQPGFVTMPLPVLEGKAAMPSVVDVYVNNALQGSRDVAPGPFELTNVPVQSGGGTVQLVTRDLLGREIVSEVSYYASTQMLRRGLHDFSYEAGFLRQKFGLASNRYGSFMASTSHRYGLSDRITGEAHLQASRSTQMVGAAVTASLFDLALIGGSASISRSRRGTGARLAASLERRTSGLSFGLRSEYATRDYSFIGMSAGEKPVRATVQAFADMPFPGGSFGVNFVRRDKYEAPDEQIAGIFASYRIAGRASLQLYARRITAAKSHTMLGGHLAFAFGGRRSASVSFDHSRRSTGAYLSYQKDPVAGTGGGYRIAASAGPVESVEALYSHNFRSVSVVGHASHANGRTGLRLAATGGLGMIGTNLFASRTIGSSFAAVQVGDYAGVRVYADNQLVGVTDSKGRAVVPAMRAFERNMIRIDESDLPMEVQLASSEVAIRPFARTGTLIRFAPRAERGVLMQVRLEDGSALPAGALVHVDGQPDPLVAVYGGEIYVPALLGTARLRAAWKNKSCQFEATVPDNDDPQPRLEGLICKEAPSYAAR